MAGFMDFFTGLFGSKTVALPLPTTMADISDYSAAFLQAAAFTRSCGFSPDFDKLSSSDLLDKEGKFTDPVFLAAGVRDMSQSAFQCLKWSHYLAPYFAQHLGCRVWPTIGQLWKSDVFVFNPSWDDLRRWSANGLQLQDFEGRQGMNLHAWLTLESGEIIDLSLLSSLAAINPANYGEFDGGVVWGRDPAVLNKHRYFPMAIGSEFFEAVGSKSMVPVLATNVDELHAYPVGFAVAR